MLIITKDTEKLITIVEGTGDNLTAEDEADGFVDYVMTSIYYVDGEELMRTDSGREAITKAYARMEYCRRRACRLAKQAKHDKEKRG